MAALSYLLLPLTGMFGYFAGTSPRVRFHGLQAVVYGVVWPAALYAASAVSAAATRGVFIGGALVWLALIVTCLAGRDLRFPLMGRLLWRWAEISPRDPG